MWKSSYAMTVGLDNEAKAAKTYNFDRRDKIWPIFSLGNGSSYRDDTPTVERTEILVPISGSAEGMQILLLEYFHTTSSIGIVPIP